MDTLTVVHLETFEVSPMLQEVVSTITPLVAKNGNRLEVRCAEGLGALQADLTKVRQALFNLLSNACKLVRDCFLAFRSTLPRRERRRVLQRLRAVHGTHYENAIDSTAVKVHRSARGKKGAKTRLSAQVAADARPKSTR
jgi:hypothetical protein